MGEVVIKDLQMLKAVSDPVRIQILLATCRDTARGWTAKELAAEVGVKQTAIYRHLKTLEVNGFLRVVDTRIVSGITERTYAAVAPTYRVDPELLAADRSPTDERAVAALSTFDALFDSARREFAAGIRARLAEQSTDQHSPRTVSLAASSARLSPASVAKIQRQIARLEKIDRYQDPEGDEYGLLIAFYPRGNATP